MRQVWRQRPHPDRREQRIRHVLRDLIHQCWIDGVALVPVETCLGRMMLARRIEAYDAALRIGDLQPPADMDCGGCDHAAFLDERELGRAAADVDVEDALAFVGRHPRRA